MSLVSTFLFHSWVYLLYLFGGPTWREGQGWRRGHVEKTASIVQIYIVVCWSAAQSYLTLCDPMDCSIPGFPVLHYFSEFAQIHFHQVGHVTQPSLLPSSPPALSLFEHQDLFQWIGSLHQVAQVLEFHFSISPSNEYSGWFPLGLTGLISLQAKGLSRVFSSTTVQKHQFLGAQPSFQSSSHIHTWLLENPQLWLYESLLAKGCLCFLIHCLGSS